MHCFVFLFSHPSPLVVEELSGRNRPFIAITGSIKEVKLVHVLADGQSICQIGNVKDAVRAFARPKFLLATFPKIWNFLKET
jgi:hypothetical protein